LVGYGNDFNRAVVKKIALVTPLNTLVSDHTLKQSAAGDSNIISVMSVPSTSTADNTSSSLSPPPVHGTDISISNTNATAAITTSYPIANKRSIVSRKRYNDNSVRNVKKKKNRMTSCVFNNNGPGFREIDSSFSRTVVWYFRKNVDNINNYRVFLKSIKAELVDRLRESVISHPIKYNLKLESTYVIPHVQL
ncbi:uncharacterized protein LOC112680596, partial [Sipha flava]|uniref:Uncharacterized protein LOC112680596 n=1 Tax=Sipha flava TaxID=143950 RepID=A0A8B8F863_9HEMI